VLPLAIYEERLQPESYEDRLFYLLRSLWKRLDLTVLRSGPSLYGQSFPVSRAESRKDLILSKDPIQLAYCIVVTHNFETQEVEDENLRLKYIGIHYCLHNRLHLANSMPLARCCRCVKDSRADVRSAQGMGL
jgi:hypothetical protein